MPETEKRIAGRELDALVAEHVMGWEKDATHPNLRGSGWWKEPDGSFNCELPAYSTDPAASKLVRERMGELGYWCRLQTPFEKDSGEFFAGFTEHSFTGWNGRPDNQAGADTEELAVALAAIRAMGVE